jgi:hypothetical protein
MMVIVNIRKIYLQVSIFLTSMRNQVRLIDGHFESVPTQCPSLSPSVDFVNSITIDDLDIEQWITQSAFPSPPMDTSASPLSTVEETSSTTYECQDMIVPLSPPSSLASSSPAPTTKKTKLSTIERKLRKKNQNKTAAEKYRMKKKSERHCLLDRHAQLKSVNRDLKLELENLAFRVEKFKQLFVDLLQIDPSTAN